MISFLSYPYFRIDRLNGFIGLAVIVFSLFSLFYSIGFIRAKKGAGYYVYMILSAAASLACVFSNNLIILSVLWGFLGLLLFLLINMGTAGCAKAAKKAFIIIGASDAVMLIGIAIIYGLTRTFQIDKVSIPILQSPRAAGLIAYLCLALACFAKAGVMPFHSWIPDSCESAPVPVAAYLPATLDKLLGIYLLARISLDVFILSQPLNSLLMLIGAVTIIAAVMMALIQHNIKRLLGYHAVSQVGYMVLGIGSANPIGICGAMFHMLNNTLYKQGLFYAAGNIEYRTGRTDLDSLGGLAKQMPVTYIATLIFCLSISGIPPFNGFASKWMIYQGLIANLTNTGYQIRFITVFCLFAAMLGSGLTLASFLKLLHACFLGQEPADNYLKSVKEAPRIMLAPIVILALICVVFGVFVYQLPLKYFINPLFENAVFSGSWQAGKISVIIAVSFLIGFFVFKNKHIGGRLFKTRRDSAYLGGETQELNDTRVSGAAFYDTVRDLFLFKNFYNKAQAGGFDIYFQAKRLLIPVVGIFRRLHNGVLPTYLVWFLLGMAGLFFILIGAR